MIGVDYKIDLLRAQFASLFSTGFTAYGRAFVNQKEEGLIPEVLDGSDYKDVLLDDNLQKGLCFFVVENDEEPLESSGVDYLAKVSIYFAVNLSLIYPTVTERAVSYLHRDVIEEISDSEFTVLAFRKGLPAFEAFDMVKPSDNMQPFYLVRFETEVEYQINENYNC